MTKDLIKKIKELPRLKLLIILFAIWQYISVAGMAIIGWNQDLVWLNLGLLMAFVLFAPVYESILLLIISIPFYVAIPNSMFDSLPMWRVLFLEIFAIWLFREKRFLLPKRYGGNFELASIHFLPWDKYILGFALAGLLAGVFFGNFKVEAIKQFLFYFNIYFLYIVLINTLRGKQQIFETIRYTIWSITAIVTLGFAQLIGTFLTNSDTFWVYWASNVTRLYYGSSFAEVSMYSNSWFSYTSGGRDLRMFSIMPDSQSFAYVCLIGLCIGTALTRSVFVHIRKWLWSGIRFAALGLILSGTRAVWVGMVMPFLVVAAAYKKNFQKHLAEKYLWPFIIIFALFAISPIINRGLSYFQVETFKENFLDRAQSIYNVNEKSNQGRIAMWKNSLGYFLHHSWGTGFGNFFVSFTNVSEQDEYASVSGSINERYNLPARYISAHNLYLHVLVETGIIGFLFFAMYFATIIRSFWHFIKNYKNISDFLIYFVAQALLMVLWILGAAFFDITLFNDKVLMFFLINIGLAGLIVKRYHEYEG